MPIIIREPADWDPFRELEQLQRQMDRLFRQSFGGRFPWRVGVYPLVNISEDRDYVYVRAELPGVKPENLEIHIRDKNLVIRGERKIMGEEKDVNFHRRERESGFFRRVLTLPTPVNPDNVEATCKDGILTIKIAKPEEIKPRQIKVASA
ncbi:MAG: Hsp20/alpha crystallin family protein [Deltaproteobacteria bacterium]|nr:Hsp20/alpha crystallin family protein [Deltaproteobacteria bacterium]